MATIFDGYKNATNDQIADQIALLETITLANVLKTYGNKMKKGAVRGLDKIVTMFGKRLNIEEPEVKEVHELVEENREKIKYLSRIELDKKLRQVLCERSKSSEEDTDDIISINVINEAAKLLNIDEYLTPAQKADRVYERFNERILSNIQKQLAKQNYQESQKIIRELDIKLNEMSEEQRKNIQEILQVESLTGKSIRDTIVKSGGPAMIMATVSAAGFGAFIALSTVIHAVFTTILGITLPFAIYTGASSVLAFIIGPVGWLFILGIGSWQMMAGSKKIEQEMMAQSIWFSVGSYGKFFTPIDEELPSWVPKIKLNEIQKQDEEFIKLLEEKEQAITQAELSYSKLINLEKQLKTKEEYIKSETHRRIYAENIKKELEDRELKLKEEWTFAYKKSKRLEDKVKALSDENKTITIELQNELEAATRELDTKTKTLKDATIKVKENEDIINYASQEIESYKNTINEISGKFSLLELENKKLKERAEKIENNFNKEEESRRKSIEQLWKIHFPKFQIKSDILRDVSKLKFKDRYVIEKALVELHNSDDPRAISANRGKLKENNTEHFKVTLIGGVPARIEYEIDKQYNKIVLLKFYKKNEKYMQ